MKPKLISKKQLEGQAYYINFNRKLKDKPGSFKTTINNILNKWDAGFTHSGFIYIQPDGTPIFKEYGIKNGNSYWGNRVDLTKAPKMQKGLDPKAYIQSIYNYLEPASDKNSALVTYVPNIDINKIESYIKNLDDSKYCYVNPITGNQTCGSVAFNALYEGLGKPKEDNSLNILGSMFIPDGEEYLDRLNDLGYSSYTVSHLNSDLENKTRLLGLKNSRNKMLADVDFNNVKDKRWFMPQKLLLRDGHTCIYSGTGCYYPEHRLSRNTTLIKDPTKHGWREISQSEVKPGDAIVLSNSKGEPKHFTIFDSVVPKGTKPYYFEGDASRKKNSKGLQPRMVQPGDTLLNYSPGTPGVKIWKKEAPLFRFDSLYNTGGNFSGPRRYFRATGKFEK